MPDQVPFDRRRRDDMPLFVWGAEHRRVPAGHRRLHAWVAIAGAGIAAVMATVLSPPLPRLVWNASASAPLGLYRVSSGAPIKPDDMVVAWTPTKVRELAARRHYLPANVPLVKRVVAVDADIVCAVEADIFVNGRWVVERRREDGQGQPMPWWSGCRKLAEGELLLLMGEHPASFDGRYFGVTEPRDVIGKAVLIWAR